MKIDPELEGVIRLAPDEPVLCCTEWLESGARLKKMMAQYDSFTQMQPGFFDAFILTDRRLVVVRPRLLSRGVLKRDLSWEMLASRPLDQIGEPKHRDEEVDLGWAGGRTTVQMLDVAGYRFKDPKAAAYADAIAAQQRLFTAEPKSMRCSYCHNVTEAKDGRCPSCGAKLPN